MEKKTKDQNKKVSQNKIAVLLLFILFVTRIFRLDQPPTYYFDEVYHAFTAQAYAANDPKGYEWWHKAPEGLAYEWLHPPLAKLFQAGSILILGDSSFAWRLPGVLFGAALGALLYLLGKNVFKSPRIGVLALLFWTFDGLSLTMSRITMNDVFLAFWALLAFYLFFAGRPLWQAGIGLGLALATKWSGIYALGLIGFLWFRREWSGVLRWNKLAEAILSFAIIPLFLYLASYGQFFLQGHTWGQFQELHRQIWWYQTNLKASHPYSSQAWDWPLLARPLFAYTQSQDDMVANIYLMGNPVLWWGGIISTALLFVYLLRRRRSGRLRQLDFFLSAILLGYLFMFIPWVASPRILFIYHYLPALPFLFLTLAWAMDRLWLRGHKNLVIFYLSLSILIFIFFLPHWSAIPVNRQIDKLYYWFSSWR